MPYNLLLWGSTADIDIISQEIYIFFRVLYIYALGEFFNGIIKT